jgi:hypothetical protein
MDPKIWGPFLWYILHIISFNYPLQPSYADKRIYHDFYVNLKELIPCTNCRKHYQQHLHINPITPALDSRADLVKWVIQMHNMVNISLGKPTMTVQEVLMAYQMNNYMPPNYIKPINQNQNQNYDLSKNNNKKWSKARLYFWIFIFGSIVVYRWYSNYQYSNAYYH